MLFRDKALKAERGYVDPKSYVRTDGSEVLYGRDWTQRKKELWKRCQGRCEWIVDGHPLPERCRNEANDPHHRIPRSKRRDDRLLNLAALCRMHHNLLDPRRSRWGEGQKPMVKRRDRR